MISACRTFITLSFSLVFLSSCQSKQVDNAQADQSDPYLWLEEIEGARAIDWVKNQNSRSLAEIESLPNHKRIYSQIEKIVLAKDRLPYISYNAGYVYNFWQDEKHVRGIWRRTTLQNYKAKQPKWEILLDLDKVAKIEKENWVWKGSNCYEPEYKRCLIRLSRGGKDASVTREYDLEEKDFISSGFYIPEAKSRYTWVDLDTLLVATDYGPETMSKSGYPRELRIVRRHQKLTDGKKLFTAAEENLSVSPFSSFRPEGRHVFVSDNVDFYTNNLYWLNGESLNKIGKPEDAEVVAVFRDQMILSLRTPWKGFSSGSLISIDFKNPNPEPILVFSPNERQSVSSDGGYAVLKDSVVISILENVQGKVLNATWNAQQRTWQLTPMPFPEKGSIELIDTDASENIVLANFTSFLTPPSVMSMVANGSATNSKLQIEILKASPARFKSKDMTIDQFESTSKDGTKIPYFVIRSNNLNGSAPTLLTAYGGFELSQSPYYLAIPGKVWLSRGGVYVLANIRGGGEFGPKWHQSAIKENREKVFEDLISVAEDLIVRKITTPRQLAIQGGSNGGLLVGATMLKRPDLFNSVVCEVPLLDMLRYHKLLAGHSWTAEYGNPDDPKMKKVISRYSPYQNVKHDQKLPEVLFYTSTKDDRVHPGHARKMAARMLEQNHKLLYYENMEGGHSASANLNQRVKRLSMVYTFLIDRLK